MRNESISSEAAVEMEALADVVVEVVDEADDAADADEAEELEISDA